MPHSDFDVVTGPSMPQLRTPAPQAEPPRRSPGPSAKPPAPAPTPPSGAREVEVRGP
jgi:hypothetical protein